MSHRGQPRVCRSVTALALLFTITSVAGAQTTTAPGPVLVDRADTRLTILPTARTLPKGVGSVTLMDVFVPAVQVGVTDRLSLRAGVLAMATTTPVLIFTPKYQVHRGRERTGRGRRAARLGGR